MSKRLVSINDLTAADIKKIFELTRDIKKFPERFQNCLQGRMFGLIFEKPSTRTWVSFESGIYALGGGTIYLGPEDIKLGIREQVKDVARVLDRYLAGVVLRTFAHKTITEFAAYFRKPIINGLSDFEHPCQALGDFFTLYEKLPEHQSLKLAFVGDGNNVLNSLILLAAKLGAYLHYATPKKNEPTKEILSQAQKLAEGSNARIMGTHDPVEAVQDADAVYTDVWVSMGQEKLRRKKIKAFRGFQVNEALIQRAKKDVLIMHCLPAHRNEEITDGVIEGPHSIVFDQAENRLHVQKAILVYLCT
ncbi:MAG: ornithine carbamoyltransferase [Candidatus Omnitrophica bacterium]|nr:ornithine carbamoyltransferase [Candidatus Omnitrophota bacterium]